MTAQFLTTPEGNFPGMSGDVIAQMDVDVPGTLWDRLEESGRYLVVINGWLTAMVGEHNCAGGSPESGYTHEPYCGFEPIRDLHHERATVWRIVSKDPDEIEEYTGRLLPGPDQVYTLMVDDERIPTLFPKANNADVTVWRKA